PKVLQLKSTKQFHARQAGSLEKEQSVLPDIVVGKDAIYLSYVLPDGHTVSFVSAVAEGAREVDCTSTVGCIVYKTLPHENDQRSLFTLFCDDDRLIFVGEKENEKTVFEISGVA